MKSSGSGVRGVHPCINVKAAAGPSARRTSIAGRFFNHVLACVIPAKTVVAVPRPVDPVTPVVQRDSPPQQTAPTRPFWSPVAPEGLASLPPRYPLAGGEHHERVGLVRPSPGPWAGIGPPPSSDGTNTCAEAQKTTSPSGVPVSAIAAGLDLDRCSVESLELLRLRRQFCSNGRGSGSRSSAAGDTNSTARSLPSNAITRTSSMWIGASGRVKGPSSPVTFSSWSSSLYESDSESSIEPSVVSVGDSCDGAVAWVPAEGSTLWRGQYPAQGADSDVEVMAAMTSAAPVEPQPIPAWAVHPPRRASKTTRDIAALRPLPEDVKVANVNNLD